MRQMSHLAAIVKSALCVPGIAIFEQMSRRSVWIHCKNKKYGRTNSVLPRAVFIKHPLSPIILRLSRIGTDHFGIIFGWFQNKTLNKKKTVIACNSDNYLNALGDAATQYLDWPKNKFGKTTKKK